MTPNYTLKTGNIITTPGYSYTRRLTHNWSRLAHQRVINKTIRCSDMLILAKRKALYRWTYDCWNFFWNQLTTFRILSVIMLIRHDKTPAVRKYRDVVHKTAIYKLCTRKNGEDRCWTHAKKIIKSVTVKLQKKLTFCSKLSCVLWQER